MSTEKFAPLLEEFSPAGYDEWRAAAVALLKGAPFDKTLLTKTYEGITLHPMYMAGPADESPAAGEYPGFPPYRRGTSAAGHAAEGLTRAQEYRYALPEQMNAALMHAAEAEGAILAVHLDAAGKSGLDPAMAVPGDVGRGGVSLATGADVRALFQQIALESVPIMVDAGVAAIPCAALLLATCPDARGAVGFDPLGRRAVAGRLPFSLSTAYDLMASYTRWADTQHPQLTTILIDGQPYHEGGGSAVEELASVLATGVEYLRELHARELLVDVAAPRVQCAFTAGPHFFLEIAKLRAARILWAKAVSACGGTAESQKLRLHVRTSLRGKTLHDPYVNMLRTSIEAFAAVMGGADSLHVGCFDDVVRDSEIARDPDAFTNRVAANVQTILKEEGHLNQVIDPAGGSWYVEQLTDELARSAWERFQQIEQQGGMAAALASGSIQEQIAATAAQRRANLATRKDVLVGTNLYANIAEEPLCADSPQADDVYQARVDAVQAQKAERTFELPAPTLQTVDMETLISAARRGATLGELMAMCCSKHDEPVSVTPIPPQRPAAIFERLRAASAEYLNAKGHRPQVFLANMGPLKQHKARADFSQAFFEVAGFDMLSNYGFHSTDEAAQAAIESRAPVVVICSTDDTYPDIVPPLTQAIKSANPQTIVVLAGYPKAYIETFEQSGVNEFIHLRANVYDILTRIISTMLNYHSGFPPSRE